MLKVISDAKTIAALVSWRMIDSITPSADLLKAALRSGRRLRFYQGFDPTGPQLHIGHAVGLFFLRDMQALGHEIIFLIGGFTAQIGDPSGRDAARRPITPREVKRNALSYKAQAGKLLDFRSPRNPAKFLNNATWLSTMSLADFIKIASRATVQQLLERDMFVKRVKESKPIALHELIYPVLQGYDSVAMNVDAEVGGKDQLFNMLMGRKLSGDIGRKEKFVISTRLLENPKTGKKMSKSERSYVPLDAKPSDMYGAVMALPDEMVAASFELCTALAQKDINEIRRGLSQGTLSFRDAKARLAREIVSWAHGNTQARQAAHAFEKTFVRKEIPVDTPAISVRKNAAYAPLAFLVLHGLATSKSEAKRLMESRAVERDEHLVTDWKQPWQFSRESVLKVGKRRFLRVKIKH